MERPKPTNPFSAMQYIIATITYVQLVARSEELTEEEMRRMVVRDITGSPNGADGVLVDIHTLEQITEEEYRAAEQREEKQFWEQLEEADEGRTTTRIDARIVGASCGIVEMECLTDAENGTVELRLFDEVDLRGVVPIKYHQYVSIEVTRRPGSVTLKFRNGDGRKSIVSKLFDDGPLFKGMTSEPLNDPIDW